MQLTEKLLKELQKRLKVGNKRGVHLNAIPSRSKYKFDLNRLSYIDKNLPSNFIKALLSESPLKFKISWKGNVPDFNIISEEEQIQLFKLTKAFENLINQTEAIESEKGINTFGFGFPILIRRDQLDNKLTVAPILIWSLKIKASKELNTWEIIRNDDDPIYINEILINHLQNDSSIVIEQLSTGMLEDGLISNDELVKICSDIIKSVNTTTPQNLEDNLKEKINKVVSISERAHYEKQLGNSTNSIIEFGGLFSIFEVQKQNIIKDYDEILKTKISEINFEDIEEHHFQSISSVETDPSQQEILHALETKRNILIQGPPGTGKSQTLTAILINALENNKKTLVVCEKKTALEVLHSTLIEKGLGSHCSLIKEVTGDRKSVVDSVRDRISEANYKYYWYNYSKDPLNNLIKRALELISDINSKHKKLDRKLINNKTWTNTVGELLFELKDYPDEIDFDLDKNLFNHTNQELSSILELLQKGQGLYDKFLEIDLVSFIKPEKIVGDNPYLIEQTLHDNFKIYVKELQEIKALLPLVKSDFFELRNSDLTKQVLGINNIIEKIVLKENEFNESISLIKEDFINFRKNEFNQKLREIHDVVQRINNIFIKNQHSLHLLNQDNLNSFGYKFLSVFSKEKKQIISDYADLQEEFSNLTKCLQNIKEVKQINFNSDLKENKDNLGILAKEIEKFKNTLYERYELEFSSLGLNSIWNIDKPVECIQRMDDIIYDTSNSNEFKLKLVSIQKTFRNYLYDLDNDFISLERELKQSKDINLNYNFSKPYIVSKILFNEIKEKIESIHIEFDNRIQYEFDNVNLLRANTNLDLQKNFLSFKEKVNELVDKIKTDNWSDIDIDLSSHNSLILSIESYINVKKEYFNSNKDLFIIEFNWYSFYNSLSETNQFIINELKPTQNWRKSFFVSYLKTILGKFADIDLPTGNEEHLKLDDVLSKIEDEQLKYIKDFWYSKQIEAANRFKQKNSNLSVENIYLKKAGKKHRKYSLRQLIDFDLDLFTTFFPVVLTSPDVASNLFKNKNRYFDIVIFDEASQLRLEDNLPAILKGKQVVIAGDEHQMPPSNYFSKVFDGEVEDEDDLEEENEEKIKVDKDDVLLDCESLLDFATELSFSKKYLDFHYRSKHPYLIDFSNYAFYNQRLKPLPNNFEYIPIKYIQVDGTFSDHTNEAEAEMVLSILENNINRLPNGNYPSVGIATFNITQRNLIKSKILERQKFLKYEDFNTKIQELEEGGMFVKNLENIQGDEKDVLIISTTYGYGKDGRFAQRFGPLNYAKGYKLLNVIITRAKFKIYCCSSIPPKYFMQYRDLLISEKSNNKRAVLYAYLAYCKAVSESNNTVRLAILDALAENTSVNKSINSYIQDNLESPFEEEVFQSLVEYFGENNLFTQVSFGGFRIDIVYDPKKANLPRIAIECDGAKYHSSREAYLYDRHRQKILENHGFVFHRIWSTNWWRNPKREMKELIRFIEQIENYKGINISEKLDWSSAFNDNNKTFEENFIENSFIDTEKDILMIQAIDNGESINSNL